MIVFIILHLIKKYKLISRADTVPKMTLPKDFHYNVLQVLNALDTTLPSGSHVVLIGLVDGSFIYPQMANRLHPLGNYKWK